MNVLYTCDNNYVWLMGISVISMFENNTHIRDLTVYLLGEKISSDNKRLLQKIGETYGREILVVDVPQLDIPEALVSSRWPISAFLRLFSGQLLPENLNRVLYLDCDTIITGDIELLDKVDLQGRVCLGVKDCIGKQYKKNIGLEDNGIYVNAGVLLLNLEMLRCVRIQEIISRYMEERLRLINYADQDILNGIFNGKIGVLDPKYNVMTIDAVYSHEEICWLRKPTCFYTEEELKAAVLAPVIIHYTTNMRVIRPWFANTNHPFASDFRKYFAMSPWNTLELSQMVFSNRESKLIGWIEKLPRKIALRILGFIHAWLKPRVIRLKAGIRN